MKMDYPKIRINSGPTPIERLLVCDKCGSAKWTIYSPYTNKQQHRCNDGVSRYRDATNEEKRQALKWSRSNKAGPNATIIKEEHYN